MRKMFLTMISRRLLRIKVMQVYYAQQGKGSIDLDSALNELDRSTKATLDLYYTFLHLLLVFRDIENERIEASKDKYFPTDEDRHPITTFSENPILEKIAEQHNVKAHSKTVGFFWNEQLELLKRIWAKVRQSAYYQKYLSEREAGTNASVKILTDILEKEIAVNIDIEQQLEEKSIYWNDDLEFVISTIIRNIKAVKTTEQPFIPVTDVYQNEEDRDFAIQLLKFCLIYNKDFDEIIERHIINWEIERIALTDRLLLHLAISEFVYMPGIPARVSINEYIEISKYYSTMKSSMFLNGLLEKIYIDLKASGKAVKSGRGLIGDI